jgi:hypothetical protein
MRLLIAGNNLLALLGIHYDQFPEAWPILSTTEMAKAVERDGPVIKGLSGMTKVLPAWAITELLNIPALVAAREKGEDIIVKDMRLESSGEVASAHKARKVESEAEL